MTQHLHSGTEKITVSAKIPKYRGLGELTPNLTRGEREAGRLALSLQSRGIIRGGKRRYD